MVLTGEDDDGAVGDGVVDRYDVRAVGRADTDPADVAEAEKCFAHLAVEVAKQAKSTSVTTIVRVALCSTIASARAPRHSATARSPGRVAAAALASATSR